MCSILPPIAIGEATFTRIRSTTQDPVHACNCRRPDPRLPLLLCPWRLQVAKLNQIAYDRAAASVRQGNQVMVFVHARKDTVRTAQALLECAMKEGCPDVSRA